MTRPPSVRVQMNVYGIWAVALVLAFLLLS